MSLTYLGLGYIAAGLGAGLCLLGAALSIAKLASAALEGTARQPEAAGALRTSMIIPAALIEGLGFFALVICLLVALNLGLPKGSANSEEAQSQSHASQMAAPSSVAPNAPAAAH